uniref:Uncharacterized protein n=1 Tax=Burkholderia sp. M701 TaxID=326454 RepID=V5YNW9_9BURK|nr:hypothetical protein [Burkholderia sp. M701]
MKHHVKVADSDAGSKLKATAVPRPKLSTGSEKSTSQVFRSIEAWERYSISRMAYLAFRRLFSCDVARTNDHDRASRRRRISCGNPTRTGFQSAQ